MAVIFAAGSPAFKKLGLDPNDLTDEWMIDLVLSEPRMLRRPIVVDGDRVLVGGRAAAGA